MMAIPEESENIPIIEADVKKNFDKKKVEKVTECFWEKFNIDDLPSANKELSDIMESAFFTPSEKFRFTSSIKKSLKDMGVNLDILR